LVIEDDRFLLKAYEIKFNKEGLGVITASDGITGLELAKKEKPNLIILDLMLPKMNGFEFLKKIKSDDELKNIPVVALSNLGQRNDYDRTISLGAKEYFIKTNYTLEEIAEKIKRYL